MQSLDNTSKRPQTEYQALYSGHNFVIYAAFLSSSHRRESLPQELSEQADLSQEVQTLLQFSAGDALRGQPDLHPLRLRVNQNVSASWRSADCRSLFTYKE